MMNTKAKIVKPLTLRRKILKLRKEGHTIAFTNGCFDILHLGHVRYLEEAKYRGTNRILIVGLNSDRSVRKIKGPKRPFMNEKGRAAILAALACTDYVTLFNEATPLQLIEILKPDVLIKGEDWKEKGAVGGESVRARGGTVEYIKYIRGCSSTSIIHRIAKSI